MSVKKLLVAVLLSAGLSSLAGAQTTAPGVSVPATSEQGLAESDKPEPSALADEAARPEVTAAEKEAFQAIALCFALRSKGRNEEAKKKAEGVLRLLENPGSYRGFYMRGLAQQELGNVDSALADYDKSIQLNPRWGIVYYSRGMAYAARRDHDRAIADFDRVIKLSPRQADIYVRRGDAYSGKGDHVHAIADYSEAIRLKPDLIPAFKNRATAYEKAGDKTKAQADRERAAELEKQVEKR